MSNFDFDFAGSTVPVVHQDLPITPGSPDDCSGCFVGHLPDGRLVFLDDHLGQDEDGSDVFGALRVNAHHAETVAR